MIEQGQDRVCTTCSDGTFDHKFSSLFNWKTRLWHYRKSTLQLLRHLSHNALIGTLRHLHNFLRRAERRANPVAGNAPTPWRATRIKRRGRVKTGPDGGAHNPTPEVPGARLGYCCMVRKSKVRASRTNIHISKYSRCFGLPLMNTFLLAIFFPRMGFKDNNSRLERFGRRCEMGQNWHITHY